MAMSKDRYILSGCLMIGIGLGFIISSFIGWGYGMPAGVLIGMGVGRFISARYIDKAHENKKHQ